MTKVEHRFWLKPLNDAANEAIAEQLNKQGDSAGTYENQTIVVGEERINGVYQVPEHAFLTMVGHSVHKPNVRAYVQAGEGAIRLYINFKKIGRTLGRTKAVKTMRKAIDLLGKRKQLAVTKTTFKGTTAMSFFYIYNIV